ncbi:class I SAM-dependent methyltransferase [Candidatus Parcubacteria bacterium]|nr:class I SAM-dependent methyltransferase [Candidatus Parcubacteria bacterium]
MKYLKNCILCESSNIKVLNRRGILKKGGAIIKFDNFICRDCGLVFLNPQPEEAEYAGFYEKYEKVRHGLEEKDDLSALFNFGNNEKGQSIYEFIQDYLGENRLVLDIGCASGQISYFLKRDCNCNVLSVEPSHLLSQTNKTKLGLNMFNGSFDDFYKVNQSKFNILIMHHVFEHFIDPLEKLKQFRDLLLEKGVVYIEVPDVSSFKKPANVFFDYMHPFSYSPKTIKEMVNKAGYKIVKVNKNKLYRLQIIIAPKESMYEETSEKEFWIRGGYENNLNFIRKRRVYDFIKKLYLSNSYFIKLKHLLWKKQF